MSKIIGIDANEANVVKRVGISEYAYQIITGIYELRNSGKTDHSFIIYLKNKPLNVMPRQTSWWKYKVVGPSKMWTQIAFPTHLYLTREKPDILFSTSHYAPRFCPVPTIISVMDIAYLRFPEMFRREDLYQLKSWTKYSVKKASKVITISQSSKDDIIKYYSVPEDKVKVIYLGLKDLNSNMSSSLKLKEFGIKHDFILFVGTLQPRKNIAKLIQAFSILPKTIQDAHQLVIIGKKGWLYDDILIAPKQFGVEDNVLFLDYVSDEDLPLFYRNAKVFVLPSLYEGFGLPVLEAMRFDCPVITSNISSLPEAGGDAALYTDPNDENDIARQIEKVVSNEKLRQEMIEKGREHFKKFTWQKAAKDVLAVLDEVVAK